MSEGARLYGAIVDGIACTKNFILGCIVYLTTNGPGVVGHVLGLNDERKMRRRRVMLRRFAVRLGLLKPRKSRTSAGLALTAADPETSSVASLPLKQKKIIHRQSVVRPVQSTAKRPVPTAKPKKVSAPSKQLETEKLNSLENQLKFLTQQLAVIATTQSIGPETIIGSAGASDADQQSVPSPSYPHAYVAPPPPVPQYSLSSSSPSPSQPMPSSSPPPILAQMASLRLAAAQSGLGVAASGRPQEAPLDIGALRAEGYWFPTSADELADSLQSASRDEQATS